MPESTLREALGKFPGYRLPAEVGSVRFGIDRSDFNHEFFLKAGKSSEDHISGRISRALDLMVEIDHDCGEIIVAKNEAEKIDTDASDYNMGSDEIDPDGDSMGYLRRD